MTFPFVSKGRHDGQSRSFRLVPAGRETTMTAGLLTHGSPARRRLPEWFIRWRVAGASPLTVAGTAADFHRVPYSLPL